MQQVSNSVDKLVTHNSRLSLAAPKERFVINLCASTTPVALVQPNHAGLKRFTFFVSRRLEEGRERFRLHMGYFDSQEEAEKILDLVRDVYPAAWAGVAPGIKLRARAAEHARTSASTPAPTSAPIAPIVAAIAPAAAAAPKVEPGVEPIVETVAKVANPVSAVPVKLALVADLPRAGDSADEQADEHASAEAAASSLNSIRATIDSLADTRAAKALVVPGAKTADAVANTVPAEIPGIDGRAVLRLLESAPIPAPAPEGAPARPAAAVASAIAENEPAVFAVQLLWSVQSIDMKQVPQLAIFSAYTLYGAEGNRDGRRWYGLRLGFFTDAVSAKQVAQYVRSEFTSVSVVPVTNGERTRASVANTKLLPITAAAKRTGPELNFIDDVPTDTATSGSRPAVSPAAARAVAAVGVSARATAGKRVKLRVAQPANFVADPAAPFPAARGNRPLSLEETLEILGAGTLQIDQGRGERLNDDTHRERKLTPPGSRFGRLVNRLAERFGTH